MSAYSIATRGLAGRKIPQGVLAPMNALLFGASEPGAWYDPSDLSTLFQDSAGTTPVTAVEQFVGLILDKSKGLALGVEIAPNNGTFVASTGWVVGAGTAISGGLATSTGVVPGTTTVTSGVLGAIGKWYQVTVSVSALSAGQFRPVLFGNVLTSNLIGTTGVFTFTVLASSTVIYLQAYNGTTTGALSGFSVRELSGNHASQATSTKRPKYSRRVNLLTNTGFSGAVAGTPGTPPTGWGFLANLGETVSVNADGSGGYAWRVKATNNRQFVSQLSAAITANSVWDLTVKLGFVSGVATIANLLTTSGVPSGASVSYYINNTLVAGSASPVSGDTLTNRITTAGAGGTVNVRVGVGCSSNSTGEAEFSKLSLTLATDAHLPYQRVNTDTDYDADPAKFPGYLRFDGVDDALQTGNIDFTGTDKMTVWAGVTKLSDAATGILLEHSVNWNVNNGTFIVLAPGSPGDCQFGAGGTVRVLVIRSGFAAPISAVVSMAANIAGPSLATRVNGVTGATSTVSQGTGNYGNYPLYIGARAGTSFYFNGRIYQLIVRGAQSSLSQIEAAERYTRRRMMLP